VPSVIFPLYKEYRLPLPGIREFSKKLDEFKPDLIHLHSPDTIAWAALKYAKKRKIPIMATHHTNFYRYLAYYHLRFLKPVVWAMLGRLYRQMRLITTPSQVTADELIGHNIPNVFAIPWGVDFKKFNKSFRCDEWKDEIAKDKNKVVLLCVCRLTWEKDLKTLVQAYNLLKQKRNDFAMVIAGDGPARKELESMMPGANFLGHMEGEKFSKTYASSDIFVFPSTTESFGNVTIEAMASGLVPVVADAGGSKSLVKNGQNGFLSKPKDAQDICDKVCLLLDDTTLRERMRNNALEFSKNFIWEKVFDNLLQVYQKLLAN
jgi:phosphatidylinositol alpha 1,6-mannosyltransferase